MPSSKDRRRLEVPSYMYDRLAEIAETEDRTVASVLGEALWLGLGSYQPTWIPNKHLRKLNERARHVLELAREEAIALGHDYIGTEHLLLGTLSEAGNMAAEVLTTLGVTLDRARAAAEERIGRGEVGMGKEMDYTPRVRTVMGLAMDEAEKLGGGYVRAEHILLGIVRDSGGMGAELLDTFGVLGAVRKQILTRLGREPAGISSPPH